MHISPALRARFTQMEYWAITAVFSIGILLFTWQGLGPRNEYFTESIKAPFEENSVQFGYYKHYFIPHIFRYLAYFACFMALNFRVVPGLPGKGLTPGLAAKLTAGILAVLVLNIWTDFYLKAWLPVSLGNADRALSFVFQSNLMYTLWLVFAFVTYSLAKYGGLLLLSRSEKQPPKISMLQVEQLQLWILAVLISLVLAFFAGHTAGLICFSVSSTLMLFSNFLYFRIIPAARQRKRPALYTTLYATLAAIGAWAVIATLVVPISRNEGPGLISAFITSFSMVLVVTPLLWYWYGYQQKRQASVQVLEQKLGQSTAQLDQLRAQINPHFLFNALNTVYALALAEGASRTSEAIEKISDMMRFMLRDNQEAFIPLGKDIDYLQNFMGIQQMRLGSNPGIDLQYTLPEHTDPTLTIAPMLLIPFVENAFKHGISMQSPSFIHLHIRLEGATLHVSLRNSVHDRIWLDDPEKNNHGIGLSNVKERLRLLYADRHLLDIRQENNTYAVELTLILR